MAESRVFMINENFNLDTFVYKLTQEYQQLGYMITVSDIQNGKLMSFSKNTDGFSNIVGMSEKTQANIVMSNGQLFVNFNDDLFSDRIISIVLALICCQLIFIPLIIGFVNQYGLGKKIANSMQIQIASMN